MRHAGGGLNHPPPLSPQDPRPLDRAAAAEWANLDADIGRRSFAAAGSGTNTHTDRCRGPSSWTLFVSLTRLLFALFAAAEIDFDVDFSRLSIAPPLTALEQQPANDSGPAYDSGWRERLFRPRRAHTQCGTAQTQLPAAGSR